MRRRLGFAIVLTTASAITFAFAQQASPRPVREPDIKLHCVGQSDAWSFAIWRPEKACGFLGNPTAHACSIGETEVVFSLYANGKRAVSFVIDRIEGTMSLRHEGAAHNKYTCKPITPGTKKF